MKKAKEICSACLLDQKYIFIISPDGDNCNFGVYNLLKDIWGKIKLKQNIISLR